MLRWHKGEQAKHRLSMGDQYWDRKIVVAGKKGDWLYPDTLTEWFDELADELELGDCLFHSLRHTYASLMVHYGTQIEVVSKMVGHADLCTTERIYHPIQKDQHRTAGDRLDEGLKRAMGQ